MAGRRPRLSVGYRREIPAGPIFAHVTETIERYSLETICVSGRCPNRGECFSRGSLAFMILGDVCTRRCGFCAVRSGKPAAWDPTEAARLAEAAADLRLRHVVITSVARDDLADEGAGAFAAVIEALRQRLPSAVVEVLTPDFHARPELLDMVCRAEPHVFNHNVETVQRLSHRVRPQASYRRSLAILAYVKRIYPALLTKSGMMLGLGETPQEIRQTLQDLRQVGCDLLTMGQYLPPSPHHLPVARLTPEAELQEWRNEALALGFQAVAAGPLVRSSYFADELLERGPRLDVIPAKAGIQAELDSR
ncbi:MAG: lipoyl synthase [Elusimicrobia bacterium]|nr:lipoyl synthase [Elusimicrobiota bacterium]